VVPAELRARRHRRHVELVDRDRVLVEEFGFSEEIVAQLPPDDPNPTQG
jgi:hypothetical protein